MRPSGPAYLELVTELLQRLRQQDPVAGLWEAADLQWWYTRDPHPGTDDATVWLDGSGRPVVAAVFTRWAPDRYGCDLVGDAAFPPAWEYVRARAAALAGASIEMEVAPDDEVTAAEAGRAGFTEAGGSYEVTWLDAADRPAAGALPDGYTLVSRAEPAGTHPMARRNGPDVEQRLRQCSLYDPELDLAVRAPDGTTAAYSLFWPDRRTGVGLVEPVRVEDAHAGRGVAGAMLRAGLELLAARGCRRLKVSHDVDNEAARRLYHGAGFVTQERVPVRIRPPRTP